LSLTFGERQRQGLMARRPVFPPSEHSSLSRKGSKGYAPGRVPWQARERHSMPLYEHVFLSRQDASTQQVEELTTHLKGVIEQMGGKVAKLEQWGVKSLSYRLRKNRKAHYTFMNLDTPPAVINEIERQERLNEDVLRYLTVRVDEHEEGPSVMMRKVDRDRERDDRGGGGFRDRDRGGFRDRDRDRGSFRDRDRDRESRPPRDDAPASEE
jgi:small subunit ribosomal protein S6